MDFKKLTLFCGTNQNDFRSNMSVYLILFIIQKFIVNVLIRKLAFKFIGNLTHKLSAYITKCEIICSPRCMTKTIVGKMRFDGRTATRDISPFFKFGGDFYSILAFYQE